jgi:hypothetical protein
MKKNDGISVFPVIGELRDRRNYLYSRSTEFFVFDQRNFLIFAIDRILEFRDRRNFLSCDQGIFFIFVIDGIFNFAIDGIFKFMIDKSSDRVKRSH